MRGDDAVKADLAGLADPERAVGVQRFFKTGPGEYGEGDRFVGVTVPQQRQVAGRHADLSLEELQRLLDSHVHEHRLVALLIAVRQYQKGAPPRRQQLVDLYLRNTDRVNNWDLVDLSAPGILGEHLLDRPRGRLRRLARSSSLWERRIAMLATFAFIRRGEIDDTLELAEQLLGDDHDLIHKASGWMLREVGKRDVAALEGFLDRHHQTMPRTMLRYAIERLPDQRKRHYLGRG